MTLIEEYHALETLAAADRGRRLPALVARLLEGDGYNVRVDAKGARPRDADLIASRHPEAFLVEIKSGSTMTGIDVIDGHHARLLDMPTDVVGLIVSRAGFAEPAIRRVESRRVRPILLVDGAELEAMFSGMSRPSDMIEAKRTALVRDAVMRFFGDGPLVELPGEADWWPLPSPDTQFVPPGRGPVLTALGADSDVVFVDSIPDVDWTTALGVGASLDVDLNLRTFAHLRGAIELLRRNEWVTPHGRFAIHQLQASWHGAGASAFVDALEGQADRYAALPGLRPHGTETAVYFDQFGGGVYTLVMRVITGERPWIFETQLSLQLPGVPLDPSRIGHALKALGVDREAAFRALVDRPATTVSFGVGAIPIEVVGDLVTRSEEGFDGTWVGGLVIRNPFSETVAGLPDDAGQAFSQIDVIPCTLRSWFPLDRRPEAFWLQRIETVRTASALVVRAVADW